MFKIRTSNKMVEAYKSVMDDIAGLPIDRAERTRLLKEEKDLARLCSLLGLFMSEEEMAAAYLNTVAARNNPEAMKLA